MRKTNAGRLHGALCTGCAALAVASAAPGDFIWNGAGGTLLWTDAGNWVGGAAPPFAVQDRLVFGATGGVAQSPDAGPNDWTDIVAISFGGADAALTLVGTGTITLSDADGITEITNDSDLLGTTQTVDIDIIATGDNLILDALFGDLVIGGDIDLRDAASGNDGVLLTVLGGFDTTLERPVTGANGSLLKDGAGVLTLGGENTYGGGTTLMQGTIVLGDDSALGTGSLTVAGDSAIQSDDDDRTVGNDVSIAEAVTLTFSGSSDLDLTGTISGDGALLVDTDAGDVRLILRGANSYTGGTTLAQGTIVLANNNALGAGDLTVTGNGTVTSNNDGRILRRDVSIEAAAALSFSGINDLTVTGVISGDGILIVNTDDDDTRLVLRAENTWTGGTVLARGTVVAGDDAAFGTGTISVTGNSTLESSADGREISNDIDLGAGGTALTVAGDFDLELSGVLSGGGGLTKDGDATLTLSGDNTYVGDTNVDGGTLLLAGTLTSNVNVNDGGTFGGDGSITGMLTAFSGGTVAPGDDGDIQTLTVNGDYDQQAGSTLAVTLSADDGDSDLLDVTGNVTLAAGSTIRATPLGDGFIRNGQTFTAIQAGGTLTDNGVEVETDSATVTVSFNPDSDTGDGSFEIILFRAADAYANAADAGNNQAIGLALDGLQAGAEAAPGGDIGRLLGRLDTFGAADYNAALVQLSPERYNALTVTGFQNAETFSLTQSSYLATRRLGVDAAFSGGAAGPPRTGSLGLSFDDPVILASAFAGMRQEAPPAEQQEPEEPGARLGNYVKLQGIFVNQDPTENRTGFDSNSFGGQVGVDINLTRELIMGVAFGYLSTDVDLEEGLGELSDNGVRAGPYLSWTFGNVYVDGSVTFAYHLYDGDRNIPALGLVASSDYEGYDLSGYLGLGYHHEIARDVYLTPAASVQYSWFTFDGFTEEGAGAANLVVQERDSYSLRSRLGLNLSSHVDWGWRLFPYVFAGWEHEFGDDDPIDAAFAAGSTPFIIDTGVRAEDAVYYGGGVNVLLKDNVSAFIRVEGTAAGDTDATGFAGGVSIAF